MSILSGEDQAPRGPIIKGVMRRTKLTPVTYHVTFVRDSKFQT